MLAATCFLSSLGLLGQALVFRASGRPSPGKALTGVLRQHGHVCAAQLASSACGFWEKEGKWRRSIKQSHSTNSAYTPAVSVRDQRGDRGDGNK